MSFQYVRIHYGPSESFHTFAHRPQRLRGLRFALQKLGFRVDLVPCEHIDLCAIEMCGYEVFRCNIKSLNYNMAEARDPVAQRAVAAVLEATSLMQRARSYLWSWALIDSQIFKPSPYTPKNYWAQKYLDAGFKPMGRPCADCCEIVLEGQPKQMEETRSNEKYYDAKRSLSAFARYRQEGKEIERVCPGECSKKRD
ncbi:hypothetical protein NE865_13904 [Phthorimaea operculella]|nr:hypothetical protein NE865_13904 [Phthorimaea operculella]